MFPVALLSIVHGEVDMLWRKRMCLKRSRIPALYLLSALEATWEPVKLIPLSRGA